MRLPLSASSSTAPLSAQFEDYYRYQAIVPADELDSLFDALSQPLPLVMRVSRRAALSCRAHDRLIELFGDDVVDKRLLTWAVGDMAWSYRLAAGTRGGGGKSYHRFLQQQQSRGALHRQESASMVPALILAPKSHHAVLDMCAAPGSKTIQLVEMAEADAQLDPWRVKLNSYRGSGFVLANDASLDRVISLNHRLQSTNVASPR